MKFSTLPLEKTCEEATMNSVLRFQLEVSPWSEQYIMQEHLLVKNHLVRPEGNVLTVMPLIIFHTKTVFDDIFKYQEERSTVFLTNSKVFWRCDQTLSEVIDVSFKLKPHSKIVKIYAYLHVGQISKHYPWL